ncbi:DUF6113 family protein [Microbacterium sp. STN6]|uniref:DUF6113 family protein n=1 Tax=Microbacterium sp. STN6 TaxID=2995588 RepID=UPI00226095AD|nr:DUF6113 family protein [Microbacterium sp. STN6]MCX7521915.1 DUF6113 family protein [Microbacterium sp. STN6]
MTARILNFAVLLVLGAIVGAVGTVAHQATITMGGVRLPSGIVLALLTVACVVTGIRLVTDGRIPALAFGVGLVAVILLFSQRSPGGSVLIPANTAGQVWVYAPVAIAAIAIAWPHIARRPPAEPVAAGVN